MNNADFEEYYKAQKIVPEGACRNAHLQVHACMCKCSVKTLEVNPSVQSDSAIGEWEAFMASLRTTLPTTFRINGSGKFAEDLRNQLETDFLASFTQGPVKVPLLGRHRMQSMMERIADMFRLPTTL